jgi:bifunctional non-homologous end joining protein LigD
VAQDAINQGQELVIGGYTMGSHGFDALFLGYFEKGILLYPSRTRNGFTPATRQELFKKMQPVQITECPFANLPESRGGRWGAGLTATKMKECRWLLCRKRHSSHNVEFRTMPHRGR